MAERVLTKTELKKQNRYPSREDYSARADVLEETFIVDTDVHIADDPVIIEEYMEEPYVEYVERIDHLSYEDGDIPGYSPSLKQGWPVKLPASVLENKGERIKFNDGEVTERLLAEQYVDLGVLFPSNFLFLSLIPNPDYAAALASAYNDYMIDRFLDRSDAMVGAALVAPQHIPKAAEELDRVGDEKGMEAFFIPGCGLDRPLGHHEYDPLWEVASKHDLSMGFHAVGNSTHPAFPYNTHNWSYILKHSFGHELACLYNATDLVARGVPERFPDLEFAFLEGGMTWMSFAMHRFDREWWQHGEGAPRLQKRPSTYLEDFYVGTQPIETPASRQQLEWMIKLMNGEDSLVFATDLPHHDWDAPSAVLDFPVSDETKEKILGGNAMDWLGVE